MVHDMQDRVAESSGLQDVLAIERVIANWAVWRDAGDWERFGTLWHPDGYMTATWFQGSASEFIEVSRAGFDRGVRISHFLGGSSVDVSAERAIAQTKMTITQRALVHEVEADVVCHGRFYDFMARVGRAWKIVRRQPIYEHDRIDPLDPAATLVLDPARLNRFPVGYRHLAYMQSEAGFTVKPGLPGLTGSAVSRLYDEGEAWLRGSDRPGVPL